MKTKLIILGCGNSTGVPTIDGSWGKCKKNNIKNYRTRCSAIIIRGKNSILIDTSPDIKYQLIKNNIKRLSHVIYTHEHADQTNGLFELRPFYYKQNERINVYGNDITINFLKKRFDFCFKKKTVYPPIVKANIIKKNFSIGKFNERINFKTLQLKHGSIKTTAYIFNKTAYISDCNDISIIKINKLKNLNYLILDCLKVKRNWAHFNLDECLYVHKYLSPKKMFLTNLHSDLDYNYLLKKLPKNIIPAHDGMSFYI